MSETDKTDSGKVLADALGDDVDADIAKRLRVARQAAVDSVGQPQGARWWLPAVPIGGAVAAALVVMMVSRDPDSFDLPALGDQELAAVTEMELLESLEMLAWLDEQALSDAG